MCGEKSEKQIEQQRAMKPAGRACRSLWPIAIAMLRRGW